MKAVRNVISNFLSTIVLKSLLKEFSGLFHCSIIKVLFVKTILPTKVSLIILSFFTSFVNNFFIIKGTEKEGFEPSHRY